ncbi:unnamed protein product [Penicillium bialowiezense]
MASMNNDGYGPIMVPGFNAIPLNYELAPEARFAHGLDDYRHTNRLTKREMAMLRLMLHVTEQPGWDLAVLDVDETRLTQWLRDAKEGVEGFLISTAAWDWCLAELRDKAMIWQATGHLLVFDSSSAVCQADLLTKIPPRELQKEIALLGSQLDYDTPLVDPYLFPLVYGRSNVLVRGEHVSLDNLWKSAGQVANVPPMDLLLGASFLPGEGVSSGLGLRVQQNGWSNRFQWLPCEVKFDPQTIGNNVGVQITSYVNNLHPEYHKKLYTHLEHLIASAVPSWNDIFFYCSTLGRRPLRILTYGCQIHNNNNNNEDREIFDKVPRWPTWSSTCDTYGEWRELCDAAREYIEGPEAPEWKRAYSSEEDISSVAMAPEMWNCPEDVRHAMSCKRRRKAWFDHPEPGISFTYEQWKNGQFTGRAIIPQYDVRLEQRFKYDGLQVVVEITRIELTPDNPEYAGETHFHTEGLRNDHIVATSLYVVECKNVTQTRVAFEHEDLLDADEIDCEVRDALNKIFDLEGWESRDGWIEPPRALRTFGSVGATEGHLLSWPNTYRSKREPIQLSDPSQPGHMTVVKLRLVDPHYRVCSTRNVPPQQHHWWAAAAEQASGMDTRLPLELVLMVMEHTDWWPMPIVEAQRLREIFHADHERARRAFDDRLNYNFIFDPR